MYKKKTLIWHALLALASRWEWSTKRCNLLKPMDVHPLVYGKQPNIFFGPHACQCYHPLSFLVMDHGAFNPSCSQHDLKTAKWKTQNKRRIHDRWVRLRMFKVFSRKPQLLITENGGSSKCSIHSMLGHKGFPARHVALQQPTEGPGANPRTCSTEKLQLAMGKCQWETSSVFSLSSADQIPAWDGCVQSHPRALNLKKSH